MAPRNESGEGDGQRNETEQSRRTGRRWAIVTSAAVAILPFLLIACTAEWIGGRRAPPKVSHLEFHAVIDGVSDCTATFTYVLRKEGIPKGSADIDYLDNDFVFAHDFYVIEAGHQRYVGYVIEHVDCAVKHGHPARIAAIS